MILSAGTNGHLTVWEDHTQSLVCKYDVRLHQATIKDLAAVNVDASLGNASTFLVLTVGDDNGLGITLLRIVAADGTDATFEADAKPIILPRTHAASATGVAVLSHGRLETSSLHVIRILTAGNDQIVRVWDISADLKRLDVEGINVSTTLKLVSDVADVSSVSIFSEILEDDSAPVSVLVCGVGMEVWKIPKG